MDTLTLPARLDSLEVLLRFVLEGAEIAGASPDQLADIRLGIEEILTNICFYAYPEGEGRVAVSFDAPMEGMLSVRITDWGLHFDPTVYAAPNLEVEFSERDTGGMGIFLARSVARRMIYERTSDANQLMLLFDIQTGSYGKEKQCP